MSDAEPRVLLTSSHLRESLLALPELSRAEAPALLCVDSLEPSLAQGWQPVVLQAEDIAFLQYTSGSTAMPKGVQVTHGNLVANELLIRRGFGIDLNPDKLATGLASAGFNHLHGVPRQFVQSCCQQFELGDIG